MLNTLSAQNQNEWLLGSVPDKSDIAAAFSKAAASYDKHAVFQRDVGNQLLERMPLDLSGKVVVDLGCGTGYFSKKLLSRGAYVICVDLSASMLEQARLRCGDKSIQYCVADAESLPLNQNRVDYVFSSLALQWCQDLSVPLKEINRVLKPKGEAFFSTLLDGSLQELKMSWEKVDKNQHINTFISPNQVKIALAQSQFNNLQLDFDEITIWYDSAFSVMRDLKGIGANHVNGRSRGLTSRKALIQVEHEYQVFKNHLNQLPVTYQVCLGAIQR
ncbi:malonyl-ACP O-methyltransferase BioC [Vibrio genomosp. F10]|uniref:Malonyl-[acyl-carrier protein] O-methyltransferase n=1 Tax=Vibrio genomosp. F10 str. ZF-129 TaxID=1187848 RepID=A0A1E5BEB9_9VIBR|nr:malonyl-ACP O-methyltransferase BioC [Vibrio genomosp. F10]OEE33884.1 malonyl-[acyl-carrier protein] O-methyltransferase BioC [Vibrio genomosp. F10 str. ZF-129]OEE95535.1 malonyl-[acyl-carrier protein] O-methyltransferase BioC [Vibrio genomosp. F10 str. 9ZC157]OEF08272.1 malonyl-[acyl-carrier protein] O-methyltransferase BioC [Vibrio genomosp. F10 str. 9ZB36]